jgi:curved DNA-binding protein CbpA
MDEKSLRRAFRDRSRVLHPDVRGQSAEDLAGVPSVYELNAAFEAVKPLLVKT